jgi:putative phage-type endonuclease
VAGEAVNAQNTPAWWADRMGKFTGSKAAVIMGALDTSGLASYLMDLAWERVYGARDETYRSGAMDRGHEIEPQARAWYSFEIGDAIEQVGFVPHPTLANVGCSPDGLRAGRVVEIKCPLHKAWMEVKRTGKVPAEYRWQCRWNVWSTGSEGTDFVCFHPIAGGLVVPLEVTDDEKAQMAARVEMLEPKVQKWVEILQARAA